MESVTRRRKRAREKDSDGQGTSPRRVSANSKRVLPRELESCCLAQVQDEAYDHAGIKRMMLSCAVSPVPLPRFVDDTEAARTPSQTFGASADVANGYKGPVSARELDPSPNEPAVDALALASELKVLPGAQVQTLEGERTVAVGVSSLRHVGQKRSVLVAGRLKPMGGTLPKLSQLMGPLEHDSTVGLAREAPMVRPCGLPSVTSTSIPIIKQLVEDKRPLSLPQQCIDKSTKEIRTTSTEMDPVLPSGSSVPQQPCNTDDVSSDEELVGIPDPDVRDLEVSFSQEKLEELSVTEKDLVESIVLTLCDGLANSLSEVERDRMSLLNLLTIELTQQSSPIILGRSEFQEVFGDSIRGGVLSRLSRRHCMIYIDQMSSQDEPAEMGVKVRIKDTSTNGIRVNGKQLKNGQTHELDIGDVVTLLRIHRNEEDLSLEYKLVRLQLSTKHMTRINNKSKHDGRYVRPSDSFFSELADLSNRRGLSPIPESVVVSPCSSPARGIVQKLPHDTFTGSFTPAGVQSLVTQMTEASEPKLPQRVSVLSRRIRCTLLFADPSAQHFSESSQPLEEADLDQREELSEALSSFAQIPTFDASSSHRATTNSIDEALHDDSDVIFYIGGGDENHLVIDAPNGLSARLNKDDLSQLLLGASSLGSKLVIVIAPSSDPACLLAECGAPHVCYLISASKHSLRVTAFIRALFAGLLKGFHVHKSYMLAKFVALNDLLPFMRPPEQICKMLPLAEQHDILIGSSLAVPAETNRDVTVLLSGYFIPVLSAHFLGRDAIVSKVKSALDQNVRVCNVYGARGVGKSSIAIQIAKTFYRTRSYTNGVHYVAVDKLVEHVQNGSTPVPAVAQSRGSLQPVQRENALEMVMQEVESLLRSLPESDLADRLTTLVVLDGCNIVLPALELFVLNTVRAFPWVQILLTSTEKVQIEADDGEALTIETVQAEELGKLDCAKLFFKQARSHLTSRQIRQHFSDTSIEALVEDERVLGTAGNPLFISRLVYELESQSAID